ncbi:MAG: signal peptidase II [Sphingosinicella sp.]
MAADAKVRRNRAAGIAIAFLVFVFDQATKWVVTYPLNLPNQPHNQSIRITSFFNLKWVENPGVSLGLFGGGGYLGRWVLVGLTSFIALLVAWWMWRERRRDDALALALILGGALGNILDRVRFGFVVDFADLHFGAWRPFLVFNVGDAAITIGVLLLLVRALLMRESKRED